MAKLNGVKTLAETIVYGGVTYVKTDEAPKAGDIVRANEAKLDVTAGAYYVVKAGEGESYDGPVHFVDDSGDRRSQQLCDSECSGNYTVFRRQETPSTSADDIVTVDGVQYRKLTRKAAEGDLAIVTKKGGRIWHRFNVGDFVKVTSSDAGSSDVIGVKGDESQFIPWEDVTTLERLETPAPATPTSLSEEYVIHDGTVYRKESRVAAKDELVSVVKTTRHGWNDGVIAKCIFADYDDVNKFESDASFYDNTTRDAGGASYGKKAQWLRTYEYRVLVPVTTVTIDGNEYDVVKRRANVGETVLITDGATHYINVGAIVTVRSATDDWATVTVKGGQYRDGRSGGGSQIVRERNYVVLTPKAAAATPTTSAQREYRPGDKVRSKAYGWTYTLVERKPERDGRGCGKAWRIAEGSWMGEDQFELVTSADDDVSIETPKPASTRLAVGDYAKVVAKESGCMVGINVGDIVKVIEVRDGSSRRNRYALTDAATEKWWGSALETDVVRATDAEVAAAKRPNVKVGDTVRITRYQYAADVGTLVTVTSVNRGGTITYEYAGRDLWGASADAYELVTSEPPVAAKPTPERLKVGEYARVVVDGKDVANGDIVRIDEDDEDDVPFKGVKVNGDTDEWDWFRPDQLERIDAETAKWYAIGRQVGKYKVGDVVRVIDRGSSRYSVGTIDIIAQDDNDGTFVLKSGVGRVCPWIERERMELLAPVETLFTK